MRYDVLFGEKITGWLEWIPDAFGVNVTLESDIPCDPLILLRCYAETDNGPLLAGLPEPRHGKLHLERHISKETLKEAGCLDAPPRLFYLSDGPSAPPKPKADTSETSVPPAAKQETPVSKKPEKPVRTGDELLDKLLEKGELKGKTYEDCIELSCPFAPDKPFLLAHMFVLCNVENGVATVKLQVSECRVPPP